MGVYDNGVVSLCFDDSYVSHFATAAELMRPYGYTGTLYPIFEQIDKADAQTTTSYCTTEQVLDLVGRGWEVGTHAMTTATHSNIASMTPAELRADLAAQLAWMRRAGITWRGSYAYPLGAFNGVIKATLGPLVDSARTINSVTQKSEPLPPGRLDVIRAQSGVSAPGGYTVTTTLLSQVKAAKNWLILVLHDIQTTGSGANTASTASFTTLLSDIAASGVAVAPVGDVVDTILGRRRA